MEAECWSLSVLLGGKTTHILSIGAFPKNDMGELEDAALGVNEGRDGGRGSSSSAFRFLL